LSKMSTFFSYLTLALAASTMAFATPTRTSLNARDGASLLNPALSAIVNPFSPSGETVTNARRFSAGLPPVAPSRRNNFKARNPAPSGTPNQASGYIQVADPTTNTVLGYISATPNVFGEYGPFTTDLSQALKVSFDSSAPGGVDIVATNSVFSNLPYFGGVQGFSSSSSDINSGSANYLFISPTTQTPANSPPVSTGGSGFQSTTAIPEDVESAIWHYNAQTNQFTAQWVNSDSFLPTSTIVYVPSEQALAIVGDLNTFNADYGVNVHAVTLTLVSA